MNKMMHSPGTVRDAIIGFMTEIGGDSLASEIEIAVESNIGEGLVTFVRSYLRFRRGTFRRTADGRYQLKGKT